MCSTRRSLVDKSLALAAKENTSNLPSARCRTFVVSSLFTSFRYVGDERARAKIIAASI
jgi:hypothetical protein